MINRIKTTQLNSTLHYTMNVDDNIESNKVLRLDKNMVDEMRGAFSNHEKLIEILKERKEFQLYSKNAEDQTIFRLILEEVFNGNEVLRKVLNSFVTLPNEDENSADFGVMVDFSELLEDPKTNLRQTQIFEDLLHVKNNPERSKQKGAINGMSFSKAQDCTSHHIGCMYMS